MAATLLGAAVLLTSCGPASTPQAIPPSTVTLPATSAATGTKPAPLLASPTLALTEVAPPTALPIATSRGPNLEATDPSTVRLDSGGLQVVEFFRFT